MKWFRFAFACLVLASLSLMLQCAGSRGSIRFDKLEYPVSMSGFIYGRYQQIRIKDTDLEQVGQFSFTRRQWSIGYTFISLSDQSAFEQAINEAIRSARGEAMVNLEVQSVNCSLNGTPGISLLPFWPGCAEITFIGEIVVEKN